MPPAVMGTMTGAMEFWQQHDTARWSRLHVPVALAWFFFPFDVKEVTNVPGRRLLN